MTVRQLLPDGLAEMAPGPRLAAALDGLDLSAVAGSDLIDVLQARSRQLAHEQAQLLATMAEIGWCDPHAAPHEVARLAQLPPADEHLVSAADEIRAALAWTRTAAYREYHFAHSLIRRLPTVFTALDQGRICRSKAWLFSDLCAPLTDEQAQVVVERLLPKAGRLTTGELAARIKKMALALDPEWAARRYTAAVRDRDVIGYLDEDGTATVTGRRLPADQAAAACARIEDLAKTAKRAGYPGRIGPLRADIYLGLLDGRWTHHTREEIITDLLTRAATPDAQPTPGEATRDDSVVADAAPTDDQSQTHDAPVTHTAPGAGADPAADGHPAADSDPETGTSDGGDAEAGTRSGTPEAQVGIELRVRLSTLLGLDRHPGEIAGWGPITAETARTLAAAQHRAEWRYAITDPDGQLILGGITRRRPIPPQDPAPNNNVPVLDGPTAGRQRVPLRGGIVELHIPATLLTDLAAHPQTYGPWSAVINDLAIQYHALTTGTPRNKSRTGLQDPTARFAGAVLRRHIQIRDRFCIFTGCRCPARHADLDHTVDYHQGGPTTEANTGPACRHDHLLKHEGGWQLRQPKPGHFSWTSPLGREYHTRPQPIIDDLPDPLPGPDYPDDPSPDIPDDDASILPRPPPGPEPPPPAPTVDPDEPPPF